MRATIIRQFRVGMIASPFTNLLLRRCSKPPSPRLAEKMDDKTAVVIMVVAIIGACTADSVAQRKYSSPQTECIKRAIFHTDRLECMTQGKK